MVRTKLPRWLSLLWIGSLMWLSLKPGLVSACSCAYDPNLTEAERVLENYQRAHHEIVFVGEVVKTELYRPSAIEYSTGDPVYVTFAVHTVYKGNAAPEFTLVTAVDEASCGYSFTPGETYLVFVGDDFSDGSWNSGLCSGNQVNPSAALLAVLGVGASPGADGDAGEQFPGEEVITPGANLPLPSLWLILAAVLLLLLGAVIYWRLHSPSTSHAPPP